MQVVVEVEEEEADEEEEEEKSEQKEKETQKKKLKRREGRERRETRRRVMAPTLGGRERAKNILLPRSAIYKPTEYAGCAGHRGTERRDTARERETVRG